MRRVHSNKDREEHDDAAEDAERRDLVVIDETWEQNRHRLSQRHDDRENDGAKLRDREEDEKLTDGGADGENDAVDEELRMFRREAETFGESALHEQRRSGEQRAEEIHATHHLDIRNAVRLEHLALPVGREAVEDHVQAEQKQSGDGGYWRVLAVVVATAEEEHHPDGDRRRHDVLVQLVLVAGDDAAHDHDGNDFARLGENLCGEADELQRFVLQPGTHDVGERRVGIFEERRTVAGVLADQQIARSDEEGEEAIGEHQELRVFEKCFLLAIQREVLACHDLLLQHAPR